MIDDEELRARLREPMERLSGGRPHLERVARRGRFLRLRRHAAAALASALLAAGVAVPLAALFAVHGNAPHRPVPGGVQQRYGIHIDTPNGWDSRLSYDSTQLGPVLWTSSAPLPSGSLAYPAWVRATEGFGPADVLISLHEFVGTCPCEGFHGTEGGITIGEPDFTSFSGLSEDQAFAERLFTEQGRYFALYVVFSDNPAPDEALGRANDVLSTLRIDAGGPGDPEPVDRASEPPTFSRAPGWQTVSQATTVERETLPLTWATNAPLQAEDLAFEAEGDVLGFHPDETVKALPADGVVIIASATRATPGPNPNFPERSLPLEVSDAEARLSWEGQIADDVPEYVLWRRVGGWDLDVRLYFGTLHPDATTLTVAQQELDRLRLPSNPSESTTSTTTELPGAYQGWTTHIDTEDRVSIDTPDSWTFNADPVPALLSPSILFGIGNESVPSDPKSGDFCAPESALQALPSDGALFWLIEYTAQNQIRALDFPERPETLQLDPKTLGAYECSGRRDTYLTRFQDHGRYFQFQIALGPEASDSVRQDVVTSLNTFAPVLDESCLRSAEIRAPGAYEPTFSAASGASGDTVVVTGYTPFPPRNEGGQYTPDDRVEVWWNDDVLPAYYGAARPGGPPQRLASQNMAATCAYRLEFTVPSEPPGAYPVTVRAYGGGGYSWPGWEDFDVTS